MAKLTAMPEAAIISGWKGIIDFYLWMGIPCARKWPRSPGHHRAPAVEAAWAPFAWAASNWQYITPQIQDAYREMAKGTPKTARDLFMQTFMTPVYLKLEP